MTGSRSIRELANLACQQAPQLWRGQKKAARERASVQQSAHTALTWLLVASPIGEIARRLYPIGAFRNSWGLSSYILIVLFNPFMHSTRHTAAAEPIIIRTIDAGFPSKPTYHERGSSPITTNVNHNGTNSLTQSYSFIYSTIGFCCIKYYTNSEKPESLRLVIMVAKFLDLNKLWSCKYGSENEKIDKWLSCAWL